MVVLAIPSTGQNTVLLPLRVFNLKKSTAGAFEVPFRGLSREKTKWQQIRCCFRIVTPDLRDDTNFKTRCLYSKNTSEPRHFFFQKFHFHDHPILFIWEFSTGACTHQN